MAQKSDIDWTEFSWNPVTGCDPVGVGCKNCYAKRMATRLKGMHQPKYANGFKVACHESALQDPKKRKKPTTYFVDSMGDIFHEDVSFDFIDKVYASMALNPQDTFIILTKRYERMFEYASGFESDKNDRLFDAWYEHLGYLPEEEEMNLLIRSRWPLPNVWHGHSISNQDDADKSVILLLNTESAKRIISFEPALDFVELTRIGYMTGDNELVPGLYYKINSLKQRKKIDLIIMGGESGPGARPMHPDWVRSMRDQCSMFAVPFYFKQWGEWEPEGWVHHDTIFDDRHVTFNGNHEIIKNRDGLTANNNFTMKRVGKEAAGHKLDGRKHRGWPS